MLILALFLPGSRAELVTTNKDNGSENNVADGSQVAEVSYTSVWQSLVRVARKGALRALPCSNDMALKGSTSVPNGRGRPSAVAARPWVLGVLPLLTVVCIICHMMPGLGGGSRTENFNYRIPPSWSPENDRNYSFRAYMTDISLWVMLTDLAPHQQCAAIIMRLGGQARELARMISPQEIVTGGWRDGRLLVQSPTCWVHYS